MEIRTPEEPKAVLWQGPLELVEAEGQKRSDLQTAAPAPAELPVVSIGAPEVWRLEDLYRGRLPHVLKARLGEHSFRLVRFAVSFRARRDNLQIDFARFAVELVGAAGQSGDGVKLAEDPIAYDLFPSEVLSDQRRDLAVTLAPTLKFSEIEGSIGKANLALHLGAVIPVVSAAGIGENVFDWSYEATDDHPVVGSKWMFALLRAPALVKSCVARLSVSADIRVKRWLFSARVKESASGDALASTLW